MRVEKLNPPKSNQYKQGIQNKRPDRIMATGTGIKINIKESLDRKDQIEKNFSVLENNDPKDPLVSKRILDSLDIGLIKFNQKERDALARIMNKPRSE